MAQFSRSIGLFGRIFGTIVGLAGMVVLGGLAFWTVATFVPGGSQQLWALVVAGLAILYYCGNYIEAVWRAPWPPRDDASIVAEGVIDGRAWRRTKDGKFHATFDGRDVAFPTREMLEAALRGESVQTSEAVDDRLIGQRLVDWIKSK